MADVIRPARPDEWSPALELALAHQPHVDRAGRLAQLLRLVAMGEIDPTGILVLEASSQQIQGVQVVVPLAGAGGLVWPPALRADVAREQADSLVRAGLTFLRERGVKVAQAILGESELARSVPLARAGFVAITDLLYLRHDLAAPMSHVEREWQLTSFDPSHPQLFQKTLLRTYAGSLDCPELSGIRSAEEIVAGHKAQGRFDPQLWRLAFARDEPIGVVLLTPLEDEPAWDMAYMGVVPESRGEGWGRALVAWAIEQARKGEALELQVSVDRRNAPARNLYHDAGFVEVGQRQVWLHLWPTNSS